MAAGRLGALWAASAAVLAGCLLASFREPFAGDLPTLVRVNGPRVLFAAGVGAALALAGALRIGAGVERPLRDLRLLALATGAAGGGFLLAGGRAGGLAAIAFVAGAALGAAALVGLVHAADRRRRGANLAAAALLAAMAGIAALAGTYARARRDAVAPAVAWLLGDLGGATFASGGAMVAVAVALLLAAQRPLAAGDRPRLVTLALLAFGAGTGAAGPLAFVGGLVPRTVRGIAGGGSGAGLAAASAAAGAATVAAIDAVPRLLVGGYDFPWNASAALLAIPIFLGWNRARLRREVGRAGILFEALELAVVAALTLVVVALALLLSGVIRQAT